MAKDTRGQVPGKTSHLQRLSLDPPHWRQARWLLAAEALAVGLLGVSGLVGVAVRPAGVGFSVAGVPLTPALSWTLLGIGVAGAVALIHRRFALLYSAAACIAAIALVVIAAVAASHQAPGPLGLTAPAILLWAVLFCYNFTVAFWLVPDHLGGPAWVRKRPRHSADRQSR